MIGDKCSRSEPNTGQKLAEIVAKTVLELVKNWSKFKQKMNRNGLKLLEIKIQKWTEIDENFK